MTTRMRAISLVIALLLALPQAGCSRTFVIEVNGDGRGQVTFSFQGSEEDVGRVFLNIVEFVVQEQTPDGRWVATWELQGSQRLNSIDYGAKYDGLKEVSPAKPLSRGGRYRALASELSWPSPKGHSAVAFSIQTDGSLGLSDVGE